MYSRQAGFVLLELAGNLHAAVAPVQQLAVTQQLARDILQGKTLEAVECRPQQLDTIEYHPAGKLHGVALAVLILLAPVAGAALPAEQQAPAQMVCQTLQVPGVKIHHVPADQHIGIVVRNPVEKGLQQVLLGGAGRDERLLRTLAPT